MVSNDTFMGSTSLGSMLLGRTREAVLGVLFTSAGPLHQREIVRRARMPLSPVQRELATLVGIGVVLEERVGNQKRYRPNSTSPIYDELRGIAAKTFGIAGRLRDVLEGIDGIDLAFVFGSVARATDTAVSDIDLLVVGDADYIECARAAQEASANLGRTVSLKLYRAGELRSKLAAGNEFLDSVLAEPKLFVIGAPENLHELVQAPKARGRPHAEPEGARSTPKRNRKSPGTGRRASRRS